MLYANLWKEQFSLAYLRAVASVAECDVLGTNVDVNKIDATLRSSDSTLYVSSLEVQMKCSARDIETDDEIVYPLDVDTFNVLRRRAASPRILVVVTVPPESGDWIRQTNDTMALRHCAYFVSLEGRDATDNSSSVNIRIPKTDIFSASAIRQIFERVNKEVTH